MVKYKALRWTIGQIHQKLKPHQQTVSTFFKFTTKKFKQYTLWLLTNIAAYWRKHYDTIYATRSEKEILKSAPTLPCCKVSRLPLSASDHCNSCKDQQTAQITKTSYVKHVAHDTCIYDEIGDIYNPSVALPAYLTLWTHRNTNGELFVSSVSITDLLYKQSDNFMQYKMWWLN